MSAEAPLPDSERILVLAPFGRDGAVAAALLSEAGLLAVVCASLDGLARAARAGAGCVIMTREAVQTADLQPLFAMLAEQPSWSDLPIIIITEHGGGPERNPGAIRLMGALGNVTFLERPFHPWTLLSLARSALRSRRRQYEARAQLRELARRETALRDSESRLRTLAENIPVLAWTAEADGWIFWYNSRWYEYTGMTPGEMQGWGWTAVHDPRVLPTVMAGWKAALGGGQPFEMVFPLRGADGVFRPFLTRAAPVREDGRVVRWFGTCVDISAEREAEAAIRASTEKLRVLNETLEQQVAERTERLRVNEARLRTIFQTSHQAQALLDVEGTLLDANATLLGLLKLPLDAVVGLRFWDAPWFAGTPGMAAIVREAVSAAVVGDGARREIVLDLGGRRRSFDFSVRPIRDDAGRVVAILPEATDITARRQTEEALRQAQKMEAIGQLTGGIAHDFNNMLQGIGSGVDLMQKRIRAGRYQEVERYVEIARQSVARAASLTHRLLAFSRRQALAPRRVDVTELVRGMAGLIRQTVGPSVTLSVDLMEACRPVVCDPNQLENALLNLAINARDAMAPDGGELRVRTRLVTLTAADLAGWPHAVPGEYVRLSVTDTGVGMAPDVLEHAFEPFFTTKPAGQGTGLGLSQVFGFISQSNGAVRIETRRGQGTSVHLDLPSQAWPAEAPIAVEPGRARSGSCAGTTVLLVEDEADIRDMAADALRDLGCAVIEAEDATGGLGVVRRLAERGPGALDVLVADVGLPGGLNGRQLADAARGLFPDLPVLLITGYAGEALGPGVQLGPSMELLTKPFALDALAARVEAMLTAARRDAPARPAHSPVGR